jgi:tetratricopeptide (TPR) repeat protein
MSRVFISYRRADSAEWANNLNRRLGMRYGEDLIFQDVEDIQPGDNWLETIKQELQVCQVFLILIGPYWLVDKGGRKRLEDPGDILRMEVVEALASQGIVIPTLVGGAEMILADSLPEPLKPLSLRQAISLRDEQWNADVNALMERLRELILPTAREIPIKHAQDELQELQKQYFKHLGVNNAEALKLVQKTQAYLDRVMPLYPQDGILKVTRGYLFKNEAMALLRLKRTDEARVALDRGEIIFRTMLEEIPDDPSAWNGLGSIESIRGNFEKALEYIDRALIIAPNYPAALQDKQQILEHLEKLGHQK